MAGENIERPILQVTHANLERADASPFRSTCPTCREGLLLVRREGMFGALLNLDSCTLCGQRVLYTDRMISGVVLKRVALPEGTATETAPSSRKLKPIPVLPSVVSVNDLPCLITLSHADSNLLRGLLFRLRGELDTAGNRPMVKFISEVCKTLEAAEAEARKNAPPPPPEPTALDRISDVLGDD